MKHLVLLLASCAFLTTSGVSGAEKTVLPEISRKAPAHPLAEGMKKHIPDYARAAAYLDGEKLLKIPAYFELFRDIIPGLKEEKFTREDLSHSYLFFATEDLFVYGTVIGKGKGSLEKLHSLFRRSPYVVKLSYVQPDKLLVIWGNVTTPALKLKGKENVLKELDFQALISSAGNIPLAKLSGNAPKKLLKEFPELKHLSQVRLEVKNADRQTDIRLIFDNDRSPRKGFTFLNWGVTLILWHKTGVFRRIRQDVEKNQLCLMLFDPPLGKIAQKLTPAARKKKEVPSPLSQMKRLLLALDLYAADHGGKFPSSLSQLQGIYLPEAPFLKLSSEKSPYLFQIPENSSSPVIRENPALLPPSRKNVTVIFADGKSAKRPKTHQETTTKNNSKD